MKRKEIVESLKQHIAKLDTIAAALALKAGLSIDPVRETTELIMADLHDYELAWREELYLIKGKGKK